MPLSVQPDPDGVAQVVGGGYIVPSKSLPGTYRLVWGKECSCPHAGPRPCRHRRMAAAYCAAQDALLRPPPARVNISAMVD